MSVCVVLGLNNTAGAAAVPYDTDAEPASEEEYFMPDFDSLSEFATIDQIYKWVTKWRHLRGQNEPNEVIQEWFENLKRLHGPRITGYRRCTHTYQAVLAGWRTLPHAGTLPGSRTPGALGTECLK